MGGRCGSAGEDTRRSGPAQSVPFCSPAPPVPSFQNGTSLFLSFLWERTSSGRERAASHCQHRLIIPLTPSSPNLIARILSVTESRAELEKGRRACSCLLGLRGQSSRPSRPHTQPRAHHMPFLGLLRHRKFPANAQHSTTPRECSGALTSARSLDPRGP